MTPKQLVLGTSFFSFWVVHLKLLILYYRYLFQYYLLYHLYYWRRRVDLNHHILRLLTVQQTAPLPLGLLLHGVDFGSRTQYKQFCRLSSCHMNSPHIWRIVQDSNPRGFRHIRFQVCAVMTTSVTIHYFLFHYYTHLIV